MGSRCLVRIHDVAGRHFSGIMGMHVNSLACIRVKEFFRIDCCGRQCCITSPLAFQCVYRYSNERSINGVGEGRDGIYGGGDKVENT